MLVADIQGKRIYRIPAPDKRLDKNGAPKEPKKLGRVHFPVFTPNGTRVVGFMIKLPDIVGMVKQPDKFVPLDSLEMYEGVPCVVDTKENFDAPAAKRLGIDLDRCLIWTGMDVRTKSGKSVGYCAEGSVALDRGSKALGKQLGRTKGMFKSFAAEYKKAAGTPAKKKRAK